MRQSPKNTAKMFKICEYVYDDHGITTKKWRREDAHDDKNRNGHT